MLLVSWKSIKLFASPDTEADRQWQMGESEEVGEQEELQNESSNVEAMSK
jgi:hypothetical protein